MTTGGSSRGQATVAVVAGLAVAAALAVVAIALVEVAVERARAQRVADGAALAAATALDGSPVSDVEGAAGRAARAYARRAGERVTQVRVAGAAVEVRVRGRALSVPVPALLGGGAAPVAPSGVARAVLGGVLPVPLPAAGGGLAVDVPAAMRGLVLGAAAREGLPAALLAAQLRVESGFSPTAVSPVGAQGVAQFMPATWQGWWNPWRDGSPFDPAAAIPAQARYMRRLVDAAQGDLARALAFYNAGQAGAAGPPASWPAETQAYVAAVLAAAGAVADGVPSTLGAELVGPPVPRLVA